ncbi:MAG: tetratricopeptide repeat protein [Pirellulaceae bacterium]
MNRYTVGILLIVLCGTAIALTGVLLRPQQEDQGLNDRVSKNQVTAAADGMGQSLSDVSDSPDAIASSPALEDEAVVESLPEEFVGSAVCASCHSDRHKSYLETHHSRSLRSADAKTEYAGESFIHHLSQRSYDVVARGDQLWHREWKYFENPGKRFSTSTFPVQYVMGSGAFAKAYLLRDGEYLLQSPITWYSDKNELDIAPGYERKYHFGMTRTISSDCLYCHAGNIDQLEQNPRKPVLTELAIGCERCHGPGKEHAELYQAVQRIENVRVDGVDPDTAAITDTKIVHPSSLTRRQSESLCAQCHLHGDIVVDAAGKSIWDFVPGEDFADYRVHFKHDQPGQPDGAFTGHFDQMWQSKCHSLSETLTCMTCHPSHQGGAATDPLAWRRSQCNQCHSEHPCAVSIAKRKEENQDNCVACHMPKFETEIVHASTTNHRIAIYQPDAKLNDVVQEQLRLVDRNLSLPAEQIDRVKVVGQTLWMLQATSPSNEELAVSHRRVSALSGRLTSDVTLQSLLAQIDAMHAQQLSQNDGNPSAVKRLWDRASKEAAKVVAVEKAPSSVREAALEVLGSYQMESGQFRLAVETLTELTVIRRAASDWYNLGLALAKERRLPEAEKSLRKAIEIDGTYAPAYRSLSILYRAINPAAADEMSTMSDLLAE